MILSSFYFRSSQVPLYASRKADLGAARTFPPGRQVQVMFGNRTCQGDLVDLLHGNLRGDWAAQTPGGTLPFLRDSENHLRKFLNDPLIHRGLTGKCQWSFIWWHWGETPQGLPPVDSHHELCFFCFFFLESSFESLSWFCW